MTRIRQVLALSFAAVVLVFAGATGALATHVAGHQETPSCDPHPNSGGPQNKHCEAEPAPAPTTPAPPEDPPVEPEGEPSGDDEGRRGGGGGGGGDGTGVAEAPDAVPAATLPFTGLDVPQALILASLLGALGAMALALGKRRAARIE